MLQAQRLTAWVHCSCPPTLTLAVLWVSLLPCFNLDLCFSANTCHYLTCTPMSANTSSTSAWASKLALNSGCSVDIWMGSLSDIPGGPAHTWRDARAVSCVCLLERQALGSLSGRMPTAMSASPPTSRQEVISSYFYSFLQPHPLPYRHWLYWGLSLFFLVSLFLDRTAPSTLPNIKPFPVSTASGRCYTQGDLESIWLRTQILRGCGDTWSSPCQALFKVM